MNNIEFTRLILLLLPVLVSCSNETPYDLIDAQLDDVSGGRYRLGHTGCIADYYVNGEYYFDVPKLGGGLYFYYEGDSRFPAVNHANNRADALHIAGFPIKNIKSITASEDKLYVDTEESKYVVSINGTSNRRVTVKEYEHLDAKGLSGNKIKFKPVLWVEKPGFHYKNTFVSVADTEVENYKPGQTPKIDCIKSFALYSSMEEVDGNQKKVNYMAGESIMSHFLFNIDSGEVTYLNKKDFFTNIFDAQKSVGNIYFINSSDYYLRENYLRGLQYRKPYVEVSFPQ